MSRQTWLRRGFWLSFTLVLVLAGLSGLIRTSTARRYLTARLERALGRPVEVGSFDLGLLGPPRIEANSITVSEDPRFGHEYFVRAERLSIGIRWRTLLLGRLEFGTLSFQRPSLNLVRLPDGSWNLEHWLPPPIPAAPTVPLPPGLPPPAPRFRRLEVDGGRINLKRGAEKHPFAVVEVNGSVEQQTAGNWRIDLEAQPARAGVTLQEPGTLRLRGQIGSASTRLQPADLLLTWQDASLADVLRLTRGSDYGMRGRLAAQLTVRSIESPEDRLRVGAARWALQGSARIEKVHRWDFAERPANPAVNLTLLSLLRPGDGVLELYESSIETPQSNVQVRGRVTWTRRIHPELRLTAQAIALADLLAWLRSFRPNVADDLALEGSARMDLQVAGWPMRVRQGFLSSSGAVLRLASLPAPLETGRLSLRANGSLLELAPLELFLPPAASAPSSAIPSPAGLAKQVPQPAKPSLPPGVLRSRLRSGDSLRLDGFLQLPRANVNGATTALRDWQFSLSLTGQIARTQDVQALAAALGRPLAIGWAAEGPAGVRMNWRGRLRPWSVVQEGALELQGVLLRTGLMGPPVVLRSARLDFSRRGPTIRLLDARAFGSVWTGSISRRTSTSTADPEWEFNLSADRLDVAELNRWLRARPSPGLLQRPSPFAQPQGPSTDRNVLFDNLQARGSLSAEELVLSPLSVRRLRAQLHLAGRKLMVDQAQGEFYRGSLIAGLDADLAAQPVFRFEGRFSGVNLAQLVDATTTLKGRFAGEGSGLLKLSARGNSEGELVNSLAGDGEFSVAGARFRGFDLGNASLTSRPLLGSPSFHVQAAFTVAERQVRYERLVLAENGNRFEAGGIVSFSRTVGLEVRRVPRNSAPAPASPSRRTFRLVGTLEAPAIRFPPAPAGTPAKRGQKSAATAP